MISNLLTIATVTANRPNEFLDAINSIKSLQYPKFSVIIGDDSNNNVSESISKKIIPTAKYYRNSPALGEILNTNKCISLAKTKYVCLFHDDDKFEKEYFNQIIEYMDKNPQIDLAYTGRIMVDQNNLELARQVINSDKTSFIYNARDILDYMVLGKKINNYRVYINTPGLVFRKEIFDAVGGFDANVDTHCDTDFLLKILLVSNKVLFINRPLYINKIWYGLSGRTKSSERGNVLFAELGVINNFIKFAESKNKYRYIKNKNKIYEKFSNDAIAINGPFSWISLRFKGTYIDKVRAMIFTAQKVISMNKRILINPKFYFVFIGNILLPRTMRNAIHRMVLKFYLNKK